MRIDAIIDALQEHMHVSPSAGVEYWMGRDLQSILEYSSWERFDAVIQRAMAACEATGERSDKHFRPTVKKVPAGEGALVPRADYYLDRYASYLVAMNGDSSKEPVGVAQTYFAVQARRQELSDERARDLQRLELRGRVTEAIKHLNSAAKDAGVQHYALFYDAGYRGLYEMSLREIKARKGIPQEKELLDHAGREELAANEFKATQTEAKLKRDRVEDEATARNVHKLIGKKIRTVIENVGGTMPEDLPAEEPIKAIQQKVRKSLAPPKD